MRLDQALVQRGACGSRTEAAELIEIGAVFVNNEQITKKTKKISDSDAIELTQKRKFVSRGGHKLENALLHVYGTDEAAIVKIKGLEALDVGSSTGGFTDCLLSYMVRSVTCVDVGTNQLHTKLRNTPNVTVFENTDIRQYSAHKQYDIIVADLSFIALEKVIPVILSFAKKGAPLFLLIKPQFEVGKGNTKKGIVKSAELLVTVQEKYKNLCTEEGLEDILVFPSAIVGGDGNQEYFLYGIKK
jgi:23S rRNA (cytidine1920-2'-O)/16S rRNA (cytidine1409-2'-O)-methyltransferase